MNKMILIVILFMATKSVFSMTIDPDPRIIVSFMDKTISPELDILRVMAGISSDNNHLIFEVKTRGERLQGSKRDYLLLHITHGKTYVLLLPINKEKENQVIVYERLSQSNGDDHASPILGRFTRNSSLMNFNIIPISQGGEFSIPLDWIDFNTNLSFDAYTVQAKVKGNTLEIDKVYDWARKGRTHINKESLSAITLLNKICTPTSNKQRF